MSDGLLAVRIYRVRLRFYLHHLCRQLNSFRDEIYNLIVNTINFLAQFGDANRIVFRIRIGLRLGLWLELINIGWFDFKPHSELNKLRISAGQRRFKEDQKLEFFSWRELAANFAFYRALF